MIGSVYVVGALFCFVLLLLLLFFTRLFVVLCRRDVFVVVCPSLLCPQVGSLLARSLANQKMEMVLANNPHFVPIASSSDVLRVRIDRVANVHLRRRSTFLGMAAKDVLQVRAEVFHGHEQLTDAMETRANSRASVTRKGAKTKSGYAAETVFDEWLVSNVVLKHMPRATRIIFTVYRNDAAVAWAGVDMLEFNHHMKTGSYELKLWRGPCPTPSSTSLTNKFGSDAGSLLVEFETFPKPFVFTSGTVSHEFVEDQKAAATGGDMPRQLKSLLRKDPLYQFNVEERRLIFQNRYLLASEAASLPQFLTAVNWGDRDQVSEAYALLHVWERPDPLTALQLLDNNFPDPMVRAYAVSCLSAMEDEQLGQYMLQLTQVLKYEPFLDSALARFLLRRSLLNPRIVGHIFFWYLTAEMHMVDVRDRYGVILEQYLRNCGEHRTALGHQKFVMKRLEEVAAKVRECQDGKEARIQVCRAELKKIVFPESFQLPIRPQNTWKGVNVEKCRVMFSKKLPLWLVFESADGGPDFYVMFKAGDDLRQDQLTLQVIRIMDQLWKDRRLDLRMSPYECVSTGDQLGMLEVVRDSETIANIVGDAVDKNLALVHGADKAEAAVRKHVAEPLGLDVPSACLQMLDAWAGKIADGIRDYTDITDDSVLMAFGGGGPMGVAAIARSAGIASVLIPRLSAVFSAHGIGFSDIAHIASETVDGGDGDALNRAFDVLKDRVLRDMRTEGYEAEECRLEAWCDTEQGPVDLPITAELSLADVSPPDERLLLNVRAVKAIHHARLADQADLQAMAAVPEGERSLLVAQERTQAVPVYRVEQQQVGAQASGPAVLEEAFWTCAVPDGWDFRFTANRDILLNVTSQRQTR